MICHWSCETGQESLQWKHHGLPTPKKIQMPLLVGNMAATVMDFSFEEVNRPLYNQLGHQ
jgi:hypothetical protein